MLKYKYFEGDYKFSVEDNMFHGTVTGIKDLVTFEADTEAEIEQSFEEAVDDYIDTKKELDDSSIDQTAADDYLDYLESRY